jgi:hypothetical protein
MNVLRDLPVALGEAVETEVGSHPANVGLSESRLTAVIAGLISLRGLLTFC